jgi:hypothetical protein
MPGSKGCAELAVPLDPTAATHAATRQHEGKEGGSDGPSCQVPSCNADLWKAEEHHRRCRICEKHFNSDHSIVYGASMRFCQQCCVMHPVSSFEGDGRSCVAPQRQQSGKRLRSEEVSIRESIPLIDVPVIAPLRLHWRRKTLSGAFRNIICVAISDMMHGATPPLDAVTSDA